MHFETIFRNVTVVLYNSTPCSLSYSVLASCALTSSRLDDFSFCNDNNILGGRKLRISGGERFYPSNILDRALKRS